MRLVLPTTTHHCTLSPPASAARPLAAEPTQEPHETRLREIHGAGASVVGRSFSTHDFLLPNYHSSSRLRKTRWQQSIATRRCNRRRATIEEGRMHADRERMPKTFGLPMMLHENVDYLTPAAELRSSRYLVQTLRHTQALRQLQSY